MVGFRALCVCATLAVFAPVCCWAGSEEAQLTKRMLIAGECDFVDDIPLVVAGQQYDYCISFSDLRQMVWKLTSSETLFATFKADSWDHFKCKVGFLDGREGSARISIEVNGEQKWSRLITSGEKAIPVDISLPPGRTTLTLKCPRGSGYDAPAVIFCDAKFIRGTAPAAAPANSGSSAADPAPYRQASPPAPHTKPMDQVWFKCPTCGMQFDTSDGLDQHIRKRHGPAVSTTTTPTSATPVAPPPSAANPRFTIDPSGLDRLAESLMKKCQEDASAKDKVATGRIALATVKVFPPLLPALGPDVTEDFYTALIDAHFNLVERGQLDKIMDELKVQDTALIDPDTAAKIRKISGCNLILISTIKDSDTLVVINARLMETQTGQSIVAAREQLRKVFTRN
jgi:hypothetical protein